MPQRKESPTQRLTRLALLTALALIIFVVELQIPDIVPIPGVKLGLANIITVYAVYHYRAGEAFMILLVRILLASVYSGNISALIFSLSGGVLCLLGMVCIKRIIDEDHIWVSSVAGAMLHNIGQIFAAVAVMGTWTVLGYLPFLLVSGGIAGTFTGLSAQAVIKRMNKKNKPTDSN